MKYIFFVVMAGIMFFQIGLLAPETAGAASLWGDGARNMFTDRKASQVGDLLTILISENATTSTTKSTSNSKSGSQNINAGTGVFRFLMAAGASGSDNFKANGNATDTNTATGTVTVTVTEVMENGNFVVEGTQSIWNNKNEHKITLRGIVRPEDITFKNTIPSSKVADATLKFDGKGPLNAKQRQGILTQIFNILF